jgi:hypothetical protein
MATTLSTKIVTKSPTILLILWSRRISIVFLRCACNDACMNNKTLMEIIAGAKKLQSLAESLLETQENAKPVTDESACTSCGKLLLPGTRAVRGCHYSCYRTLRRMELDGLVTDADLVASGKWLPAEAGGRKKSADRAARADAIKEAARHQAETKEALPQSTATRGLKKKQSGEG